MCHVECKHSSPQHPALTSLLQAVQADPAPQPAPKATAQGGKVGRVGNKGAQCKCGASARSSTGKRHEVFQLYTSRRQAITHRA
jgi:hypothetical protein